MIIAFAILPRLSGKDAYYSSTKKLYVYTQYLIFCRLPPHLYIPSKTATFVPEFAVEDLPLDRTVTLVPAFAVKDLSLGRTL